MSLLTVMASVIVICALALGPVAARPERQCAVNHQAVPAAIQAIFNKPFYRGAIFVLRVDDLDTGRTLINTQPDCLLRHGSVRKIFPVGELLNKIGPDHRYNTPVFRQGNVSGDGVLRGDLVLVASGDLTMGGRTNPDGTIAVPDVDHNSANTLGNAILSEPDPLAGYKALAHQVAQHGITQILGDVIIDDRLFQPFSEGGEFNVRPIFVNDDVVDVSIQQPTIVNKLAQVTVRPSSSALEINNKVRTSAAGSNNTIELDPEVPQCIGRPGCSATIKGQLPIDLVPPFTNKFPLVRTFRIAEPSNYARTVFIEALEAEGVRVQAPRVAKNPADRLPRSLSYQKDKQVAELTGLPYSDDMKLILKISYNIGADTSLVLFGLTQGVNNMEAALKAEQRVLSSTYGIPNNQFHFVDGEGSPGNMATTTAVIKMLTELSRRPTFSSFFDALPILGVDGSLGDITNFQSDSTLARATGQVRAKTGTNIINGGTLLGAQAFAGYITTKSGKHLVYEINVNNVPINPATAISQTRQVFEDEGTASAILWRDNYSCIH